MQGIYAIVNSSNGRRYIGSSADVHLRWRQHRRALERGDHPNRALLAAWRKYGAAAFEFVVIEEVERCEDLVCREQAHIDSGVRLYNLCPQAAHPPKRSGFRLSPETRARQSAGVRAAVNKIVNPESNEKRRQSLLGHYVSAETRAKQSAVKKGRPLHPALIASFKGKPWSAARRAAYEARHAH